MMLRLDGRKNPDRRTTVERSGWLEGLPNRNFWGEYRKSVTTYAMLMDEPFEVDTIEGLHTGRAGDYLAIGIHGEMYPIDAAVFAATYEEVE